MGQRLGLQRYVGKSRVEVSGSDMSSVIEV